MTLKADLYTRIYDDAGVQALVADATWTYKVFDAKVPQDVARPYIVIRGRISQGGHHHFEGVSGFLDPTVQIEVYGSTSPQVEAVADAVRASLDGGSGTWGSTAILGAFIVSEFDDHRAAEDGSEDMDYTTIMDVMIQYAT